MKETIFLIIGLVVGYVAGRMMSKGNNLSVPAGLLPSEGEKGTIINPEQVRQRQEHLQKVLEMAKSNNQITNDEVQKALGVSDKTTERYLQELENQGKLLQVGERGMKVAYKINQ
jgi:predicted HTH transcriptional regulator